MLFDRQAIKPAYQKDQEPREDMREVFSEEYSQLYKVLSLLTIHYSLFIISVPVAQLDRASDSDSEGRAFESHQARFIASRQIAVGRNLGKNGGMQRCI